MKKYQSTPDKHFLPDYAKVSTDQIKKNILRSSIWTTNSKIFSQVMGFSTTLVLARLLSREDFGLMAMVLFYIGIIDTFIDLGFLNAIIQAETISSKQLSSSFWLLLGLSFFVSLITILVSPYIAHAFSDIRLENLIIYLAPILLFAPLNIVCKGILSRDLKLDILAKIELFAGIIKMIVSISLAIIGMGVMSLLIGYLLERSLLSISASIASKWIPKFEYDNKSIRHLYSFGSQTTLSSILWYIYTKADVFIIGRLLGAEILGIYSIALQFPQTLTRLIPATWHRIAFPLFSRYKNSDHLKQIVLKSSYQLALVSLPLFIGISAVAPDIITVLFSSKWHAAIFPMQILAIVAAIETINGLLPIVLNSIGRPGVNIVINIIATVIFPITYYFSALMWGLEGVLFGSILLYLYRYLTFLYITCRSLELKIASYFKNHLVSVMATVTMFLGVMFAQQAMSSWDTISRMSASIILGGVIYLGIQLFFNKMQIKEAMSFIKAV